MKYQFTHLNDVHCINPTLARGEAAGKSQLCNAAEEKSKDRDGRGITQDGHKYIKACFSFFSLQCEIITHFMLGSLRLLPMLRDLPRSLSPSSEFAAGGAG